VAVRGVWSWDSAAAGAPASAGGSAEGETTQTVNRRAAAMNAVRVIDTVADSSGTSSKRRAKSAAS